MSKSHLLTKYTWLFEINSSPQIYFLKKKKQNYNKNKTKQYLDIIFSVWSQKIIIVYVWYKLEKITKLEKKIAIWYNT